MSNGSVYQDGTDTLKRVNIQAAALGEVEDLSERGYAHLGWLLLEVSEMGYWRVKYPTFKEYLKTVAQISKKTVAQLQRYFLTVRDLSDVFTKAQMEFMGITKAMIMRQAKDYAIVIPAELKAAALNPEFTALALKKLKAKLLNEPEEEEDGEWITIEFLAQGERLATIKAAIDIARRTEPVTKSTISEAAQNADIMEKFAMEFLAAHTGDGQ